MIFRNTQKRMGEFGLALFTAMLGVWLALPGVSMATVAYTGLLDVMNERQWALMFIAVGTHHMAAVWINGSQWWTPISRSAASATSLAFYIAWTWGFWVVNPDSTAVFTYSFAAAVSALCFYLALLDALRNMEAHRHA